MQFTTAKGIHEFYNLVAWRIAAQMIAKPDSVIGLATGHTTGSVHKALPTSLTAPQYRHPERLQWTSPV